MRALRVNSGTGATAYRRNLPLALLLLLRVRRAPPAGARRVPAVVVSIWAARRSRAKAVRQAESEGYEAGGTPKPRTIRIHDQPPCGLSKRLVSTVFRSSTIQSVTRRMRHHIY
jgi:hypothetical protein